MSYCDLKKCQFEKMLFQKDVMKENNGTPLTAHSLVWILPNFQKIPKKIKVSKLILLG